MLIRVVAFFSVISSGFCSPSIIGAWQSDDGRRYAEIQFGEDHSFILLNRPSTTGDELTILTDLQKEFGTWRLEADKLRVETTNRASHERTQADITFRLAGDVLTIQNIFDPSITETYKRVNLPKCGDASISAHSPFIEEDILGKWRVHYHTHDMELTFEKSHRAIVRAEGFGIYEGSEWRLTGQVLTIITRRAETDNTLTWTLVGRGADCLTFNDSWPVLWTLERIK